MGEVDYENHKNYKGTAFTSDDIGNFFGYVYRITNLQNGRQYIGRKYFVQKENQKVVREESQVKVIGKSIMEVLPNSKKM